MDIKNIIENLRNEESLNEGINDPGIFKAVFLAGGPGSGKSFIVGRTALTSFGMRVVNSDPAFERALDKAGLDKGNPDDIFSDLGQQVRGKAKALTAMQQAGYMKGRLGLVIDGTGKDYDKIKKQKDKLEAMGYETAMIFVNTDLDTALNRNRLRARSLPDNEVESMWKGVQGNIGKFQSAFKSKMFVIDNSDGSDFERDVMRAYRTIGTWAKKAPTNSAAKKWISAEKAARGIKEELLREDAEFAQDSLEMMLRQLIILSNKSTELAEALMEEVDSPQNAEYEMEAWVVSKVTKAKDYIDAVYDYSIMDEMDDD